jgi:TolB-like protein/tetratricopeptide (TPR) repeat protein
MERGKSLYQFGPFSLDAVERVLLREGRLVSLPAKALTTLLVLVRNSGHLVEKDVLMNEVWPDEDVEEGNLAQHIFLLRKALGETSQSRKYIETVPRRGYRFLGEVREINGAAIPATRSPLSRLKEQRTEGQTSRTSLSLAVLPFLDVSGNPKTEHAADRITEGIINSLSPVPRLRVMSRSAVFRYKGNQLDPQRVGTELGVDAVLLGTISAMDSRVLISAELVDVANGWQLWGGNFDLDAGDILAVQGEIARQVTASLRLKLLGDEEHRVTQRFTENTEAYQSYLQGRRSWSKHTRDGMLQAIVHFQRALELDPGYALAYAAIVDSYLRLATNYVPPADTVPKAPPAKQYETNGVEAGGSAAMVKLRCEWDLKAMERELKRARELKSNYPAVHQWHAAYLFSLKLYHEALTTKAAQDVDPVASQEPTSGFAGALPDQFQSASLTPAEEVQVFCIIAREQITAGNFDAACAVLRPWWTFGQWPKLEGLSLTSSADLLLTVGTIAGYITRSAPVPKGEKHASELLNGAISLCEQFGSVVLASEGRIELAHYYFQEGTFDLARSTLLIAVESLQDKDRELKTVGLIILAGFDCHSGRLRDSLELLNEVAELVAMFGPRTTSRFHTDLGTTLEELAVAESRTSYSDEALMHYQQALYELKAIGNHRSSAIVENNHGCLLLTLERYDEAEAHLARARKMFDGFADKVRSAQVDDSLARVHLAAGRLDLAEHAIVQAVGTLETSRREALFAEALRTRGLVLCKLGRQREAKRVLDRAYQVAERCGDSEGAGSTLLIVIEEMYEQLEDDERVEMGVRLNQLLSASQKASTLERLGKCLELIAGTHASETNQAT